MKKIALFTFTLLFLLSGCSSILPSFESSTGNIGQSVDDSLLINATVDQVYIQSANVTSETPLTGKILIESAVEETVSGKILLEIAFVDSYQPVWVANIDVEALKVGQSRTIPFIFYSEDIESSLDLEEVRAEKEISDAALEARNRYEFDLVVRSQINESRVSFVYYFKN